MRRRLGGAPLLSCVVAALCAGCAATRPPTPRPAPSTLPSAAQLESVLAARRAELHSLRALARLRYADPGSSGTSKEAIIVARPDRIRVEVLSLFGSVFVLTADNGEMAAYARREDTVYRGHASPENLERYARVGLPVNELVDIVLGTPPARTGQHPRVSFDPAVAAVRLARDVDHGTQVVWFADALPIAAEEHGAAGQALWHATFTQYEEHGGIPIATRIALQLPPWSRSIEISLDDVDANPVLDHSIFALQTPAGSKVVDLDRVDD